MRKRQTHGTMTRAPRRPPVACFYCDQRFNRTQERATHIRHHHPGKPYRPDLERQAEEPVAATPPTQPAEPSNGIMSHPVLPVPNPCEWRDADMTSKHHLVAAITSIKRRQDTIAKQMPDLEKQLESLRAAKKQMDTERQAIEQALAAIDGESVEAIHIPAQQDVTRE